MSRELYAWVTTLKNGRQSLVGMSADGMHVPLVSHDLHMLQQLRPHAAAHGEALGQPVRLVKFFGAETLETISPHTTDGVAWLMYMHEKHTPRAHAFRTSKPIGFRSSLCGRGFVADELAAPVSGVDRCGYCERVLETFEL